MTVISIFRLPRRMVIANTGRIGAAGDLRFNGGLRSPPHFLPTTHDTSGHEGSGALKKASQWRHRSLTCCAAPRDTADARPLKGSPTADRHS